MNVGIHEKTGNNTSKTQPKKAKSRSNTELKFVLLPAWPFFYLNLYDTFLE